MDKTDKKLQTRGGDMGARVKPLEWQDFSDRGAKAQAWNEANYMIQRWSDKRWEISASYPGYSTFIEETDRFYPTLAVAKAAAQADYEARILAALEPAPDLAELVEAAKPFALLDETDDSIGDFCEKHPVEGGYVADLRAALTKLGVR